MGLLEQIKEIFDCLYISDLRLEPYKTAATKILKLLLLSFSQKELDDANEYFSN